MKATRKIAIAVICVIVAIVIVAIIPSLSGGVSDEEAIRNQLAADSVEVETGQMEHERYIDSLLNIATGKEGATLQANRRHALNILRKEYPEMSDKWNKIEISIENMEIY